MSYPLLRFLLHCSRGMAGAIAALWFTVIHLISFLPRAPAITPRTGIVPVLSNWLHFPLYAGLCWWILLAMPRAGRALPRSARAFLGAFLLSALAGLSDELHQSRVAWRHGDPIDFLTDLLAAGGLLWCALALRRGCPARVLWLRFALTGAATFLSSLWAAMV